MSAESNRIYNHITLGVTLFRGIPTYKSNNNAKILNCKLHRDGGNRTHDTCFIRTLLLPLSYISKYIHIINVLTYIVKTFIMLYLVEDCYAPFSPTRTAPTPRHHPCRLCHSRDGVLGSCTMLDSNQRQPVYETGALTTELMVQILREQTVKTLSDDYYNTYYN